jgi:VWFA-related protein
LRPDQVRRTIALVVDDLGLSFESTNYVRQALRKFLDQQMHPDDLVAIIRTGGGIGALQQFTSDKRQLYAAVEKVRWNPSGRSGVSAFAPIEASLGNDDMDAANEELNQFREDLFAVGTLGAVNYVVKGLRELPGRKSIVLISDGFKIFNHDDPTRSYRTLQKLQVLIDQASRASVVIYTINATGLQTFGLTAADDTRGRTPDQIEQELSNRRSAAFDSQEGLDYLARQTGGLAFHNTNDLSGGIRRVIEDQKGYYLIGYRPDESTFDRVSGRRKFHKLSLKVNRPGKFSVRMRNGFYGVTDVEIAPPKRTPQQQMISALVSPFGSAGVHLRLTSLFANDAKAGSIMRSFLHINARDLTFTNEADGWHKAVFDIMAVTFGDNGNVVDQIGRMHSIQLKGKTYERVLRDGFTYNITVPIKKSGAYQLRTALRDEPSERVGSASQFIEVPDIKKNRLTLSGILLRGVPFEVYQKAAGVVTSQENSDNTDEDASQNGNVAVRQFQQGFAVVYAYAIYNAQLDKATGKPQLQTQVRLFRNGQQVFTGRQVSLDPGNPPDLKRLVIGGVVQLGADLLPGEYVFQIVVTDLLAKEKYRMATQWIDFEILK